MAFLRYSKTIRSYVRGFSNCVILSLKCIDLTVHTFCHHLWFCRSAVLFDNTVLIPINGIRASYMFKYVKIETNQLGNFAHSTDGTVCIAQHMTCVYYFSLAKCLHLEKAHILDFLPGQGESKATDSSRSPSPSVKTMAPACFPCQGYWLVLTTFQGIICFALSLPCGHVKPSYKQRSVVDGEAESCTASPHPASPSACQSVSHRLGP